MSTRNWKFVPFRNGPDYLDGAIMDGAIRNGNQGAPVCYCDAEGGEQIVKLIAENKRLRAQIKELRK